MYQLNKHSFVFLLSLFTKHFKTVNTLIILGLFILFLVSVQFASAQTVDEVIDKYMAARGGKEKLNAIKSIYMEGSQEMMSAEIAVKIIKEQNKLSRTEFETAGGNGFNLITDKEAWNYLPAKMYEPEKINNPLLTAMQTELDIAGPLVDYLSKGYTAELIGKENIDDTTCYKIRLATKEGKNIFYWIETGSYMLLQSTQTDEMNRDSGNNNAGRTFVMYKNYKATDGILFAHSIEIKNENGEMQNSITTFDKIEINKPVDEKLYKPE